MQERSESNCNEVLEWELGRNSGVRSTEVGAAERKRNFSVEQPPHWPVLSSCMAVTKCSFYQGAREPLYPAVWIMPQAHCKETSVA